MGDKTLPHRPAPVLRDAPAAQPAPVPQNVQAEQAIPAPALPLGSLYDEGGRRRSQVERPQLSLSEHRYWDGLKAILGEEEGGSRGSGRKRKGVEREPGGGLYRFREDVDEDDEETIRPPRRRRQADRTQPEPLAPRLPTPPPQTPLATTSQPQNPAPTPSDKADKRAATLVAMQRLGADFIEISDDEPIMKEETAEDPQTNLPQETTGAQGGTAGKHSNQSLQAKLERIEELQLRKEVREMGQDPDEAMRSMGYLNRGGSAI